MNKEVEKETTFRKILKGLLIFGLTVGTGIAIYDHREQIGNACKKATNRLFKKDVNVSSSESVKPNTNYNNPRRIHNNNIRKN